MAWTVPVGCLQVKTPILLKVSESQKYVYILSYQEKKSIQITILKWVSWATLTICTLEDILVIKVIILLNDITWIYEGPKESY